MCYRFFDPIVKRTPRYTKSHKLKFCGLILRAFPFSCSFTTVQRYGYDEVGGIPFSVLAFRLDAGEDEKHLLKVELEGKFVPIFRRTANVKVRCYITVMIRNSWIYYI